MIQGISATKTQMFLHMPEHLHMEYQDLEDKPRNIKKNGRV